MMQMHSCPSSLAQKLYLQLALVRSHPSVLGVVSGLLFHLQVSSNQPYNGLSDRNYSKWLPGLRYLRYS
jgi:hypothetical protein